MATDNIEIVTELERCAEIVSMLMSQKSEVAVDTKGVLGEQMTVTLLAVGTRDGQVFLFDIHNTEGLLGAGYLKGLLETEDVIKIFHSCRRDSAALCTQFGVNLKNVFDTQVAVMEIETSEGKMFPFRLNLAETCERFGGDSAGLVNDGQDTVRSVAYWATRPMRPEMIRYAAADVRVLFDLYDNLHRILGEKGLYDDFLESVKVELVRDTDPDVAEEVKVRRIQAVERVLKRIEEKCNRGEVQGLEDLDENEVRALERCLPFPGSLEPFSEKLWMLWRECLQRDVEETERKIKEDRVGVDLTNKSFALYTSLEVCGTELYPMVRDLRLLVREVELEQIKRKYSVDTPLEYISKGDRHAILGISIDKEVNDVLIALYRGLCIRELQELRIRYEENPETVEINQSLYNRIRWIATRGTGCSPELKELSEELWAFICGTIR